MTDWTPHTARAKDWFEDLRNRICAEFEAIEREAGSQAAFEYVPWQREEEGNDNPGGGVRGVMKGKVFEKVGVNVSTVHGTFAPEFARTIHGAEENPAFTATGISLVAHMANPHVPAVHMNTRFLTTAKAWFGGGADLNPPLPRAEDTEEFHAALRAACWPSSNHSTARAANRAASSARWRWRARCAASALACTSAPYVNSFGFARDGAKFVASLPSARRCRAYWSQPSMLR